MKTNKNLLTTPPECHRELFTWEPSPKEIKTSYTVEDLLKYYAISFYAGNMYVGNFTTEAAINKMREAALASAPEWIPEELDKLVEMTKKHGLETILYAMDLVDCDSYPKVDQIREHIADAEVILAGLIRSRDYGIG